MALTFSHAVGYHGICTLNDQLMLCTGGSINLTQDPIMGSGVWGAGYKNVAPIAYAWNYLNLEGSVNFELTTGNVWNTLKKCIIEERIGDQGSKGAAKGYKITLLPDGENGYNGNGWCYSLSLDASEGSALSGSFNFKGDPSGNNITANGEGDNTDMGKSINYRTKEGENQKFPLAGATLVPYWRTRVQYKEGKKDNFVPLNDIINWSCSYNSDLQMLKCCRFESESPLSADYALLGEANCDGNYTIFRVSGNFAPGDFHCQKRDLTFTVGLGPEMTPGKDIKGAIYDESQNGWIKIPYAIINSGNTSMTTGASYVSAEFSFNGLGDAINPIMTMGTGEIN